MGAIDAIPDGKWDGDTEGIHEGSDELTIVEFVSLPFISPNPGPIVDVCNSRT